MLSADPQWRGTRKGIRLRWCFRGAQLFFNATDVGNSYFSSFFEQLATENAHLLLEESPGWTLDGTNTVIGLFRNSQLVRKFDWPAGMQSRGPLKQLEKLIDRSRTYFPNE